MQTPSSVRSESYATVRTICLIIGITSLAVVAWNILALIVTAEPRSVQWRVNFLEQIGNRSFGLLIGAGLLMYSLSENKRLGKRLAFASLIVGILFQMSCIVIIHDTLNLQGQAETNIARQSQQARTEIEENAPATVSEQETEQMIRQITIQEDELQQRAKSDITRAGVISLGNLIIPGLALLGLGRVGLKASQ